MHACALNVYNTAAHAACCTQGMAQLCAAAKNGNVTKLRKLLQAGCKNVNGPDKVTPTPHACTDTCTYAYTRLFRVRQPRAVGQGKGLSKGRQGQKPTAWV